MDCLHKLKDMIYKELDDIAMAHDFTPVTLERADQLTHSLKSIMTIESMKEHEDKDSSKTKTTV